MADEGRGGFKLFDFGAERRKREAAAKTEMSGRGLAAGAERATRASYYAIASRAVNELSKSPNIHGEDYWGHVSMMTEDELIVAISQYRNDEETFRRVNGDAKAYAIMDRARSVFSS